MSVIEGAHADRGATQEWARREEARRLQETADRRRRYLAAQQVSITPERSLVQRMEALQRANEIRTKRAVLKRDLKAGKVSIHDILLEPPDYVLSAKTFDLLLAVPKYGRVKCLKVLQLCRISPSKTIGGLSPRQRTELVSMLRR